MHTDTRSKNDEFETEARFYHQNGLHYFYQNGFQNQRWHSTFFSEFRLAPRILKTHVNQTIVNFSIASRILNI